jgi:RES domain-containing protein
MKTPGRWHKKGDRIVYLSESTSLAALEVFVHLDKTMFVSSFANEFVVCKVVFRDVKVSNVDLSNFANAEDVPIGKTRSIGNQWLKLRQTPLLQVPSAIINTENNYLFNPAFNRLNLEFTISPFKFDPRLF